MVEAFVPAPSPVEAMVQPAIAIVEMKPAMTGSSAAFIGAERFPSLSSEQQSVISFIKESGGIPFLSEVPMGLGSIAKEETAAHELYHALVAMHEGIKVRKISLNTSYPVNGVTEIEGFHFPESFLKVAAAGGVGTPFGDARGWTGGDLVAVAIVSQSSDPLSTFNIYRQDAAGIIQKMIPDPEVHRIAARIIAKQTEVSGADIGAIMTRATIEKRMKDAGLTFEQVMTHLHPDDVRKADMIWGVWKTLEQEKMEPREITRIITGSEGLTVIEKILCEGQKEIVIERTKMCTVCGAIGTPCNQTIHEEKRAFDARVEKYARQRLAKYNRETVQEEAKEIPKKEYAGPSITHHGPLVIGQPDPDSSQMEPWDMPDARIAEENEKKKKIAKREHVVFLGRGGKA